MTDLKPCPFCGGEALIGQTLDDAWYAMCIQDHCCKIESYWRTKAEAIAEWNARATIAVPDVEQIAEYLVNQQDEPWPGPDKERLHYWRNKCIAAARQITALRGAQGWQPGQLVVYRANDCDLLANIVGEVEGWWEVRFIADNSTAIVRPSHIFAPEAGQ